MTAAPCKTGRSGRAASTQPAAGQETDVEAGPSSVIPSAATDASDTEETPSSQFVDTVEGDPSAQSQIAPAIGITLPSSPAEQDVDRVPKDKGKQRQYLAPPPASGNEADSEDNSSSSDEETPSTSGTKSASVTLPFRRSLPHFSKRFRQGDFDAKYVPTLEGTANFVKWENALKTEFQGSNHFKLVFENVRYNKDDATIIDQDLIDEEAQLRIANAFILKRLDTTIWGLVKHITDPTELVNFLRSKYSGTGVFDVLNEKTSFDDFYPKAGDNLNGFAKKFEAKLRRFLDLLVTRKSTWEKALYTLLSGEEFQVNTLIQKIQKIDRDIAGTLLGRKPKNLLDAMNHLQQMQGTSHEGKAKEKKEPHGLGANVGGHSQKRHSPAPDGSRKRPRREDKKAEKGSVKIPCSYCETRRPHAAKTHSLNECRSKAAWEKKKAAREAGDNDKKGKHSEAEVRLPHFRSKVPWVFDTGANEHITNDSKRVFDQEPFNVPIGGIGGECHTTGIGKSILRCCRPRQPTYELQIDDVVVAPEGGWTLFSYRQAHLKLGVEIAPGPDGTLCLFDPIREERIMYTKWSPDGHLHVVQEGESFSTNDNDFHERALNLSASVKPKLLVTEMEYQAYKKWHEALGHTDFTSLGDVYEPGTFGRTKMPKKPADWFCEVCTIAKSKHKTPPPVLESKSERRMQYLHTDLTAKEAVRSINGNHYSLTIVDDYTRKGWVIPIQRKSDVASVFSSFMKKMELIAKDERIERIRSDNGGEYFAGALMKEFAKRGIEHEPTPPYSHESNGLQSVIIKP